MAARKSSAQPPAGESRKKDRAPVHLIYGGDEYLVSTNAKEIVERLCPPADQAFGLEIVDGAVGTAADAAAAVNRCIEGLQTIGFLGAGKVVWLKDAAFFGRAAQISDAEDTKAAVQKLVELIKKGLSPGQTLVISAPKVDGRSAFFKTCQAVGDVLEFDVPDKSYQLEQQARSRAGQLMSQAGLRATEETLEEFVDRAGYDTRQLAQEVEKLVVYLGGRKDVRAEDIQAIVSPARESIAWDLADAVGNRDVRGALKVLRQLAFQGENMIGLIIGLEGRFRDLAIIRECLDRRWLRLSGSGRWMKADWAGGPEAEAALSALPRDPRGQHPFRVAKLAEQANKYTSEEVRRCQALLLETHEKLVQSAVPQGLLLEFLLLRVLGPGRRGMTQRA